MASLKSFIDELDIVFEKIERIRVSLAMAREDFDYVQTRAAELHMHPTTEQNGDCDEDHVGWRREGWDYCPGCGAFIRPVLTRSVGG